MNTIIRITLLFFVFSQQLIAQQNKFSKIYNDKNKLIEEGNITNGKMVGAWKFYDDSLSFLVKIETYKDDYLDGSYIKFNSNGVVICSGYYSIKAKKNYKKYVKDLDCYAFSTEALPVGNWFYYDNDGKLIRCEIYSSKGKLKRIEKF